MQRLNRSTVSSLDTFCASEDMYATKTSDTKSNLKKNILRYSVKGNTRF